MRIYIHIGMHKTGTTSIQKTLLNNATYLETLGYRVFMQPTQLKVTYKKDFNPTWLRKQVKEAEKDDLQAIIFSHEEISTLNLKQLNSLLKAFDGYDIYWIVCFRHWVSFLPSRWTQNCKRRDTQSFPAYLDALQTHEDTNINARFDLIIKRLIATNSGNIRLISYDNAVAENGVLQTMLSAFDLPKEFVNTFEESTKQLNTRMDLETTELLRLFNGVYAKKNNFSDNELFEARCRYIPVKHFCDHLKTVTKFLQEHEVLKKQLLDLISEKETDLLLSRKDSNIARWEKMCEDVSQGLIFNPQDSKLFCDVADTKITCSEVEVEDLPVSIQEQMATAFKIDTGRHKFFSRFSLSKLRGVSR